LREYEKVPVDPDGGCRCIFLLGGRDADALRSIFGIPEGETIMAVIALGYRAVDPQRPARKPLDEIVKFF